MTLPSFLCIGAQKAGTTWLYQNLRAHPEIALPPRKEIHYFDGRGGSGLVNLLFRGRRVRRSEWDLLRVTWLTIRFGRERDLSWFARYTLRPRHDEWYSSLFDAGPGRHAGDITPTYATLDDDALVRVHRLLPEAKIIYLLRDPLDRCWSGLNMAFGPLNGGTGIESVDPMTVRSFCGPRQHMVQSSLYFTHLERWERLYGPERIHVGFLERLRDAPHEVLRAIFRFLGVDDDARHVPASAGDKVFENRYPPLPEDVARILAPHLLDDAVRLDARFSNPSTGRWLERLRSFV